MIINDKAHYDKIKQTINMDNLRKLIESKGISVTKLAIESGVSGSTINAYLNGQKIPSLTTLVSMAKYLNTNSDYLLGRTDNPMPINDFEKITDKSELNLLFNNIKSLSSDKQKLVEAYVKGLLEN